MTDATAAIPVASASTRPSTTVRQAIFVVYLFCILFASRLTAATFRVNILGDVKSSDYHDGMKLGISNTDSFVLLVVADPIFTLFLIPTVFQGNQLGRTLLRTLGHIALVTGATLGAFHGDFAHLFVSRILTAHGEAILLPQLLPVLEDLFPVPKTRWIAYLAYVVAIVDGSVASTIMAESFVDRPRICLLLVFFIQCFLCLIALPGVPESENTHGRRNIVGVVSTPENVFLAMSFSIGTAFWSLALVSLSFSGLGGMFHKVDIPFDIKAVSVLWFVGAIFLFVWLIHYHDPREEYNNVVKMDILQQRLLQRRERRLKGLVLEETEKELEEVHKDLEELDKELLARKLRQAAIIFKWSLIHSLLTMTTFFGMLNLLSSRVQAAIADYPISAFLVSAVSVPVYGVIRQHFPQFLTREYSISSLLSYVITMTFFFLDGSKYSNIYLELFLIALFPLAVGISLMSSVYLIACTNENERGVRAALVNLAICLASVVHLWFTTSAASANWGMEWNAITQFQWASLSTFCAAPAFVIGLYLDCLTFEMHITLRKDMDEPGVIIISLVPEAPTSGFARTGALSEP